MSTIYSLGSKGKYNLEKGNLNIEVIEKSRYPRDAVYYDLNVEAHVANPLDRAHFEGALKMASAVSLGFENENDFMLNLFRYKGRGFLARLTIDPSGFERLLGFKKIQAGIWVPSMIGNHPRGTFKLREEIPHHDLIYSVASDEHWRYPEYTKAISDVLDETREIVGSSI